MFLKMEEGVLEMKIFTIVAMLTVSIFMSGCESTKKVEAEKELKSEEAVKSAPIVTEKKAKEAVKGCPLASEQKAGNAKRLCMSCGEIKGTQKCCSPKAKKCGHCKLNAKSPGCCKIPKGTKAACVNLKTGKVSIIK
jgi:hypothetical protein